MRALVPDETVPDHEPVLVDHVTQTLAPALRGVVVDGTVGLGGHAQALLRRCPAIERYVGLDRDAQALAIARTRLLPFGPRVTLEHARFSQVGPILDREGLVHIDAALLDLGPSNLQLLSGSRGFSFSRQGPLDMRMDQGSGMTADSLLRRTDVGDLARLLGRLGGIERPGRVAAAIVRALGRIQTTEDLARVVAGVIRQRPGERTHPATRVFMALRIAVNEELDELTEVLPVLTARLRKAGRLAVISFHSLEDRIVKQFFAREAKGCLCPPEFPRCTCGRHPTLRVVTRHPIEAGPDEIERNPRSRSAKLRVVECLRSAA